MTLGDIIRVEDANTYVAKIPPDAKKERIGSFIKITKDDGLIVGVIRISPIQYRKTLFHTLTLNCSPSMLLLMRISGTAIILSLIHISEPTRLGMISYAV